MNTVVVLRSAPLPGFEDELDRKLVDKRLKDPGKIAALLESEEFAEKKRDYQKKNAEYGQVSEIYARRAWDRTHEELHRSPREFHRWIGDFQEPEIISGFWDWLNPQMDIEMRKLMVDNYGWIMANGVLWQVPFLLKRCALQHCHPFHSFRNFADPFAFEGGLVYDIGYRWTRNKYEEVDVWDLGQRFGLDFPSNPQDRTIRDEASVIEQISKQMRGVL